MIRQESSLDATLMLCAGLDDTEPDQLAPRASTIRSVAVSLCSEMLPNRMLTGFDRSWTNRSGSVCS